MLLSVCSGLFRNFIYYLRGAQVEEMTLLVWSAAQAGNWKQALTRSSHSTPLFFTLFLSLLSVYLFVLFNLYLGRGVPIGTKVSFSTEFSQPTQLENLLPESYILVTILITMSLPTWVVVCQTLGLQPGAVVLLVYPRSSASSGIPEAPFPPSVPPFLPPPCLASKSALLITWWDQRKGEK